MPPPRYLDARTQQELQRLALKAHQEARLVADLRHDMARQTIPSDGPYKPGDEVFVWTPPVNATVTLLHQGPGTRKDGSEVLLSHKKVPW